MARALASVINVLDPDVIVLGGGMSNIDRLYEQVPRLWGRLRVCCGRLQFRHSTSSSARAQSMPADVRDAAWLLEFDTQRLGERMATRAEFAAPRGSWSA